MSNAQAFTVLRARDWKSYGGKGENNVVKGDPDAREKTSSRCERKRTERVRAHQGKCAAFRTLWGPGQGSGCANRAEAAQSCGSQQGTLNAMNAGWALGASMLAPFMTETVSPVHGKAVASISVPQEVPIGSNSSGRR